MAFLCRSLVGMLVVQQLFSNGILLLIPDIAHAAATDGYNLSISKTQVTPDPLTPGETVVYRIDYSNLSGDAMS